MGDVVFEMLVRTKIISETSTSVNNMHKKSRELVKATSQSKMYHKLEKHLTEKELNIMKRGRNAKSFTKPKNVSIAEYRHATGLEALFGHLFLEGETNRLIYIFEKCIEGLHEDQDKKI